VRVLVDGSVMYTCLGLLYFLCNTLSESHQQGIESRSIGLPL
jgi:hypothetical protein